MTLSKACTELTRHYEERWCNTASVRSWTKGPVHQLPMDFCILEFPPTDSRTMWTYATCGMSQPNDDMRLEVHMFCHDQADDLVELLTVVAHYHRIGEKLGLRHTVNFGRGWRPGSKCEYGLVSLPYLDGPELENAHVCGQDVKCYWIVPVTRAEVDFIRSNGLEDMEKLFEERGLDYLNSRRDSLV